MFTDLSSLVTLYVAPLFMFTSLLLVVLVLLSPTLILHDQLAFLFVSSSSTNAAQKGPFLALGALGSCNRRSPEDTIACTTTSFTPIYNTSVLPANTNPDLLTPLPNAAPAFLVIALSLSAIFFIVYVLVASSRHVPKLESLVSKIQAERFNSWIGLMGFMTGISTTMVMRLWFGKMVDDFNRMALKQGGSVKLSASLGNAFTMMWIAHAFTGVTVVCCMVGMNGRASGK